VRAYRQVSPPFCAPQSTTLPAPTTFVRMCVVRRTSSGSCSDVSHAAASGDSALNVEATPVVKRAHVSSAGGDTAW